MVLALIAVLALVALAAAVFASRPAEQAASSPTGSPTAAMTTVTPTSTTTATATAGSSATASSAAATSTYQSPLGYSVRLTDPWRRSDLQSRTAPNPQGDPDLLGTELFTTRTPADEAAALRATDTGVGPALIYTANVAIYRNSRNETAMAYAQRVQGALGLTVVSIESATVDGRAGAKTTFKFSGVETQTFYALHVQDGERMWVIRYFLAPSNQQVPAGATEPGVRGVVESFRFAR